LRLSPESQGYIREPWVKDSWYDLLLTIYAQISP